MSNQLASQSVAFMVAMEGVEQVELTEPWEAVADAGGQPVLIAPQQGDVQAFHHLQRADVFHASVATRDAAVDDYIGLVLPGGVANPDALRLDHHAVELVKAFVESGKPVAAICHAPWMLVEAGVVSGRRVTSYPSLRTDIVNAGGEWVDQEVVICNHGPNVMVSSRRPDDLAAFNSALIERFTLVA